MKTIIFLTAFVLFAQTDLRIIKSNVDLVSIRDGENFKKDAWRLAPQVKPDVYKAELIDGKPHRVTFITDIDEISFNVEEGKRYNFIIQKGESLCYTQIVGMRFTPNAIFDERYRDARKGKIFVEIPEVYELVNIAIAMTPTGIQNKLRT